MDAPGGGTGGSALAAANTESLCSFASALASARSMFMGLEGGGRAEEDADRMADNMAASVGFDGSTSIGGCPPIRSRLRRS